MILLVWMCLCSDVEMGRQITERLVKAEDKLICCAGSRTRSGERVLQLSDLPPLSSVVFH